MESNLNSASCQDREAAALSLVRERQLAGIDPNTLIDGRLPWEWAMDTGAPRAVELLMTTGSDINARTRRGRGFLLHGLDTHMPRWLLIHGLRRLDTTWWRPDDQGRTPFHHPLLDAVIAQALGQRAWSEGVEHDILTSGQNPVELARWRHHVQVARMLSQWLQRH